MWRGSNSGPGTFFYQVGRRILRRSLSYERPALHRTPSCYAGDHSLAWRSGLGLTPHKRSFWGQPGLRAQSPVRTVGTQGSDPVLTLSGCISRLGALPPCASVSPVTQDPAVGQLLLALGAGLAPLNESNAGHSSGLIPVSMQGYGSPLGGPGPAPATGCFCVSEALTFTGHTHGGPSTPAIDGATQSRSQSPSTPISPGWLFQSLKFPNSRSSSI